jgi:hypothetical protein
MECIKCDDHAWICCGPNLEWCFCSSNVVLSHDLSDDGIPEELGTRLVLGVEERSDCLGDRERGGESLDARPRGRVEGTAF